MLPKHFFENFFQGKQENKLFVCMPFDDSLDSKFNIIKKIAEEDLGDKYKFEEVIRTKEEWAAGDLTEEIFNGIAHSKILLFDLSDDPKYENNLKEVSPNVTYELGVALTFRSKEDILLIRKDSERPIEDLPFDINHLPIRKYEDLKNNDWLKNLLINRLDHREKYKERVLSGVHRAMDDIGGFIIRNHATKNNYKGEPFNVPSVYKELLQTQTSALLKPSIEEVRSSVLRLLDLGIVRSQFRYKDNIFEYNYYFTELGIEVAKYMERWDGSGPLL